MIQTNLSGTYTAIASIIASIIVAVWPNLNIQASDILLIVTGIGALFGVIKQAIDHNNVVAQANTAIASASMK